MNLVDLKVEEVQEPPIPNPIKDSMDSVELAILTKAFKNMPRLSGNRFKITCGTRDEAKKLGDWKGLPETKTYAQKPLPDRIIKEIDGSSLTYKHNREIPTARVSWKRKGGKIGKRKKGYKTHKKIYTLTQ